MIVSNLMSKSPIVAAPSHTLCFITSNNKILMLLRYNPPNEGLWNGVGGRIENDESTLQSCLREAYEETGLKLPTARFGGLLNWCSPEIEGVLALYTAPAPSEIIQECDEGKLQWKRQEWVFSSSQVVNNIHVVGPQLINGAPAAIYNFEYDNFGNIVGYYPQSWLNSLNIQDYQ
jgi:8-oxo-dGTP diphosphatase